MFAFQDAVKASFGPRAASNTNVFSLLTADVATSLYFKIESACVPRFQGSKNPPRYFMKHVQFYPVMSMSCPLRGRVNRAATQVSRRPYRRYFEVETEHLQYKNVSIDIKCFIKLHGFSLGDCGNCLQIQKKRSDLADTNNFDHGHWRCASIFSALGRYIYLTYLNVFECI